MPRSFSNFHAFMAKWSSQTLLFEGVTDKQTKTKQKHRTFLLPGGARYPSRTELGMAIEEASAFLALIRSNLICYQYNAIQYSFNRINDKYALFILPSFTDDVCLSDGADVLYNKFNVDGSPPPDNPPAHPNTDYNCVVATTGHWKVSRCDDRHHVVCQSDYYIPPGMTTFNSVVYYGNLCRLLRMV